MERLKLGNKLRLMPLMALLPVIQVLVLLALMGVVVFTCSSCVQEAGHKLLQDEALKKTYESVYKATASKEEMVVALVGFEAEHLQHFQSKVDLAQLYFTEGEYVLSYQYLQRALALVKDADEIPLGVETASLELLYRLLSYLCLFRGDVVQAEAYGRMALSYAEQGAEAENHDEYSAPALYLMGQVLYASGENEDFIQSEKLQEALSSFDKAYALNPTMISSTHLLGYGNLLVHNHRGAEAEKILEDYFSLGNVNLETLSIAQQIYRATENQVKVKICEFLAYEYLVGGISADAAKEKGLEKEIISEKNWLSEYENLIDALVNAENESESNDFFGKSFCEVAYKLAKGHETKSDMATLLEIEGYFVNFPSYYWLLWQLAKDVLEPGQLEGFVPALKKIVSLNNQGIYAQQARAEIMKLLENDDFSSNLGADSMLDRILF